MDVRVIRSALADISAEKDATLKRLREVQSVAQRPEYRNIEECEALVSEVANELKIKSPFDPS